MSPLIWRLATAGSLLWFLADVTAVAQQQIVDAGFKASVEKPAFAAGAGPTVAIDEAHGNFHTAGGQYKPLADLLSADGYQVTPSTRTLEGAIPAGIKVLVISNARNMTALLAGDLSKPAFTDR